MPTKSKVAAAVAENGAKALDIEELVKELKAKRIYPGTQQNLYSYSELIWKNYQAKQLDFQNFNSTFTKELAVTALAAIVAAKALPTYEALVALHSKALTDVIERAEMVLFYWQQLKTTIGLTFLPVNETAMLNAAGAGYYSDAGKDSWDKVASLAQSAITFMTTYRDDLLEHGMPEGFPTLFGDANTDFLAKRILFIEKEKEAERGIREKAAANEAVYAGVAKVAGVGRSLYRKQASELKNFTVRQLLKQVRGNSPSGIQGQGDGWFAAAGGCAGL